MKWSWRIGQIGGVEIFVHFTFFLLLAWVGVSQWNEGQNAAAVLEGLAFVLAIFACIVLHELGHAFAARRFGIQTRDITLLPIGGVARLERMPDKPLQELWVAVAGPLVNIVIACSLLAGLMLTATWIPITELQVGSGAFLNRLLLVNVLLVVFNMIPAFPMDGGRVLRAVLALSMDYTKATQIAASIGQGIALVLGFIGFFGNPMLLFIAFFIWVGATQEASMVMLKTALSGIPARRAMLHDFHTIGPDDPLSVVIGLVLGGWQTDFPVVAENRVVGILTQADLLTAIAGRGAQTQVADVMQREFEVVDSSEMLEPAFARLQRCQCHTLPVMQGGQLIGLLTAENVGEFLMIQAALAGRHESISPEK
jgi:Zn-dependent protease/CBS domain-containing protein